MEFVAKDQGGIKAFKKSQERFLRYSKRNPYRYKNKQNELKKYQRHYSAKKRLDKQASKEEEKIEKDEEKNDEKEPINSE